MAKQLNVNLAFNADVSSARNNLIELQKTLQSIASTNVQFNINKDLNEAVVSAQKLQTHLSNAFNVKTGNLDLTKLSSSLKSSGDSLSGLTSGLLHAGISGEKAFLQIHGAIQNANISLTKSRGLLSEFATTLKNTTRWQLSSSLMHGAIGGLQAALGYAKDLDESLNNIRIVTGYSADEMASFAKEANRAAKALSTTTTEYTNASLIYYQQGLSDEEVSKRTNITIQMANAAGQSAEVVSDQLTAVWNNFYDGSKSLEHYADVMTALGAATASSTDEIAEGLNKFAAVADTVGLSYEYAASALATVTATTRQSADVVGTAFKTLFARIQGLNLGETLDDGTTLNKYSSALQSVGISIFEANGEMKAMDRILDEMGAKWQTLSKDQQTALAQTVAGVRQYTQLIALMDNWDYFGENLGVAQDSDGTLQRQANIYADSWEAASKRAKASMEALYNELIPKDLIIDLTDGFASLMDVVTGIVDAMGGFKGILLLVSSIAVSKLQPNIAQAINTGIDKVKNFKLGWDHVGESVSKAKDLIAVTTSRKRLDTRIEKRDLGAKAEAQEERAYQGSVPGNTPVSRDMSKSLIDAGNSTAPLTAGFKDQIASLKQIDTLNNQILQNSKNLTNEEKQRLATQLERLQVMAQSKAEAVDQLEVLQEQHRLLQEQVTEDFYGESDFTSGETHATTSLLVGEEAQLDDATTSAMQEQAALLAEKLELKQAEVNANHLIVEDETALVQMNEGAIAQITQQAAMEAEIRDILASEQMSVDQKKQAIEAVINKSEQNKVISAKTAENYRSAAKALDGTQKSAAKMTSTIVKGNKETKTFAERLGISSKHITTATKQGQALYAQQKKVNAETSSYNNLWNQTTSTLSKSLGRVVSIGGALSGAIKGVTSLASTINTVSNAISTISDPDVAWTQKLLSGAMAAGMAVNSLVSITQTLSNAMTALNTIAALNNTISASSLVLSGAQSAADTKEAINKGLIATMLKMKNGELTEEAAKQAILNTLQQAGIAQDKQEALSNLLVAGSSKLVSEMTEEEIKTTTMDTVAKGAGTGANIAYAISMYAISPPVLIIIALLAILLVAIIAIVAAMNAHAEAVKAANEATLKNATVNQEAIDSTQELSDSVRDLTDSYEELSAAGENTSEVLAQMDEKIPELIASYRELIKTLAGTDSSKLEALVDELEQAYNLAKLTGDYSGLIEKQEEVDYAITQAEYNNAVTGGRAGAQLAATAMNDATGGKMTNTKMTLDVGGSDNVWGSGKNADGSWNQKAEEAIAKDILKNNMGTYFKDSGKAGMFSKTGAELTVDYSDPAAFVDYYEKLQKAQSEMLSTMTDEQLADSDIYREISEALSSGAEYYEQMVPLAQAQIEAGGKLAEAAVEQEIGLAMEDVDTMEEYLAYKEEYIKQAKELGLSEDQAQVYLDNAEALSRMTDEYALAENMLKNFSGLSDKQIENMDPAQLKAYTDELAKNLSATFGDMSDEQMSIAVSIAATSESIEEFSQRMQQAMIESARVGYVQSAETAAAAMQDAVENGKFNLGALLNDDNFLEHLEEMGISATALTAASYEEQYRIVSEFHSKLNTLAFDSYTAQQELYYQQMADTQNELTNFYKATTGDSAVAVQKAQEDYAKLKSTLSSTTDETEITRINNELDDMAEKFEQEYGFEITSNAETLKNELDDIIAKIDEIQDKKIEMAMDWSGVDEVENGLKKAAEFTQLVQKEAKKTGNSYLLTAKQAREWLEFYPELGAIAETTTDGLISLNAAEVEAFISGKEEELNTSIDTKISELEAEKAALQTELDLKQKDLEAAQALAEGKLELENVSAQYLTDLRKNLTQYFLDLEMDEVTANAAALETMGVNEEEYSQLVADACETNATNMTYFSEDSANAQVASLGQLAQRWQSFGSYLINNIGPLLLEIGAAILDPTRSVRDVMMSAWNASAISVGTNGSNRYTSITGNYTFDAGDQSQITAAYQDVATPQLDSVNAAMAELQDAINSIDGQIDYLNALKNQGLDDYGNEDPDDVDKGSKDDKTEEEKEKEAKELMDTVKQYHYLTRQVEALERSLDRLGKQKERAFGADKIALMDKELETMEALYAKSEELLEAQQTMLALDYAKVKNAFGTDIQLDENGDIKNYDQLVSEAAGALNTARETYNNSAQEDADKKALEEAEALYEQRMAALEQYEDRLNEVNDTIDGMEEQLYAIQDKNYEKFNYKMELELEISEADMEMLDYYLNKIADDFESAEEAAKLMVGTMEELENGQFGGKMGQYQANLEAAKARQDELNSLFAAGKISEEQYREGLQAVKEQYMENIQAMQELDKEMMDYYGNTLAKAQEELSKYTSQMEHQTSVLEHYKNLIGLMGKSNDYTMIGKVLEGQVETTKNSAEVSKTWYESRRADADRLKQEYETAKNAGASAEELELLEKKWQDAEVAANEAQEQMLSDAEAWAEALKAVLENKLSELGQALENSLTGEWGSFDAMTTAMERANSLQEDYLTTTNQIYETNKLMRTAQQEIDKSTNSVAKRKLQAYIEETKELQNQTKLSQYELDIQQAKYDLLLAEIALEEAQQSKSTVRLQRDSEGNFGYVYTADSNKMAEAQQNLEDAQNKLYNIGLDGANDYAQKYQQTMSEMYDTMAQLQEDYLNGAFESEAEYNAAMEAAKQYYYQKLQDYSQLYSVALTTDSRVVSDAWSTDFSSMIYDTEKWMSEVDKYVDGTARAFIDWQTAVSGPGGVTSIIGGSLEEVGGNVDSVTQKSEDLAKVTKEQVIPGLESELTAVDNLTGAYARMRDTISQTIAKYEQLINGINDSQTQDWESEDDSGSGSGNNTGSNSEGGENTDSGNGDNTDSNSDNGNNTGSDNGTNPTATDLTAGQEVTVKTTATKFVTGETMWDAVKGNKFKVMSVNGDTVLIGDPCGPNYSDTGITGYVKKSDLEGFDTGGYTGNWGGSYGKLALLHKKELILKEGDTANFLEGMSILDKIVSAIDLYSMNSQLGGILSSPSLGRVNDNMLEQQVHIEASFPAVQDRNEIEEAFNNLINRASQYANRK